MLYIIYNFTLMEIKRKNKKNTSAITDDLNLDNGLNVKLKTLDINKPNVVEISIDLFAIQKEQQDVEDYEKSISIIRRKYKSACMAYINTNGDIFQNRFISDFNFTSSNLKKDYNKHVTMSLYARQKKGLDFNNLQLKIKDSLKDTVAKINHDITVNGFKCSKIKL